jgi:hypothetical protein
MDGPLESTRGFERHDPRWHQLIESATTVEQIVRLMRDHVATLAPEHLARLPEMCRRLRVKAEDDVEYWTFKLSQRHGSGEAAPAEAELLQDLFNHFLHASLRISQVRKSAAHPVM